MPNLLALPADKAVRSLVASLSDDALREWKRLRVAGDDTALHDFRVAVRRLRSIIRVFRPLLRGAIPATVTDELRDLAHSSNEARDIEVQLEWLSAQRWAGTEEALAAEWLRAILRRRQTSLAPAISQAVTRYPRIHRRLKRAIRLDADGTAAPRPGTRGVANRTVSFATLTARRAARALRELDKALRQVTSILDQDEAHRARIAGKRLRYLLESVADAGPAARTLVRRLKGLQDAVGAMHDAHVFLINLSLLSTSPQAEMPSPAISRGAEIIAERLRADVRRQYHRFRSRWSRKASRDFLRRARGFVASLKAAAVLASENVEVERKYLLSALPPRARKGNILEIAQGWIPGERLAERLRRVRRGQRNTYYRTVKMGRGVRRVEVEERTTRKVFDHLWPLTQGRRVYKRRYVVPDAGYNWEIDEFLDRKLFLAEVELEDESRTPAIPRWLRSYVVREVTEESRYVNLKLAR